MATTGRQNHGDSIGRQNSAGIDVTTVSAHQSVHVPVTVIDVRNRVQNIVAGRTIVLIGTKATALVVVTRTGVGITSNVSIIPRTSISVHGIVTDTHAVALAQEALDGIIGFTGDIRLLLYANAPANRVDTIVAFGIHHKAVGVSIELLCSNRKHRNVLAHVRTIVVAQPTIIGNIVDVVCVDTTSIRNPRIQENNSVLVLCTRRARAVVVFIGVADNSSVRRNFNGSTGDCPSVIAVMWTEIDGLTIPFGVDFEHVAIRQGKCVVGAGCSSRITIVIKNIGGKSVCPRTANLSPVTVCGGFVKPTSIEPLGNLVVHVLSDVLVVAVKARNPLVIRGQCRTIPASAGSKGACQHSKGGGGIIPIRSLCSGSVRGNNLKLDSRQDDIASLILIGQFVTKFLQSLEVCFLVSLVGNSNQAAIACSEVILRDFKGVGRLGSALDIQPIRILAGSSFLTELPLAVIVEMCGVGALSVRSIDFNGAVFGIGSGDGVAIQNEVGSVVCNLDIAGISTDFIKRIDYSIVHLAALPHIIRLVSENRCLGSILNDEVIPSRLVLFIRIEGIGFVSNRSLLLLPLVGYRDIVTVQQGIQSNCVPHLCRNLITVIGCYSLNADERLSCFRCGNDILGGIGLRIDDIFGICRIILDRIGRRIMRQIHHISHSLRGLRTFDRRVFGFGI